jgi:hypothetical protein
MGQNLSKGSEPLEPIIRTGDGIACGMGYTYDHPLRTGAGPMMTSENQGCSQTAAQLAERAREWVTSTQGQQALSRTVQEAVKETDRLRQARQIDPKTLHEPVTL